MNKTSGVSPIDVNESSCISCVENKQSDSKVKYSETLRKSKAKSNDMCNIFIFGILFNVNVMQQPIC